VDPISGLRDSLPIEWRGPVIAESVKNWTAVTENGERRLDLSELPDLIELAWMAHWQFFDGSRSSALRLSDWPTSCASWPRTCPSFAVDNYDNPGHTAKRDM
jgi:hypothetical protein